MAYLSETDRERVKKGLSRYWSKLRTLMPWKTAQLRSAVDATDEWIEDNQGSYNTALPNPFKTNATALQKTVLFCCVAAMRVSPAFARLLLGEVD